MSPSIYEGLSVLLNHGVSVEIASINEESQDVKENEQKTYKQPAENLQICQSGSLPVSFLDYPF